MNAIHHVAPDVPFFLDDTYTDCISWICGAHKPPFCLFSGLGDLYLLAMNAIHHVAPDVPFFLEGTGQSGIGANWGDGFATDAQMIREHGLSDPNGFFQVILLMYCRAGWVEEPLLK